MPHQPLRTSTQYHLRITCHQQLHTTHTHQRLRLHTSLLSSTSPVGIHVALPIQGAMDATIVTPAATSNPAKLQPQPRLPPHKVKQRQAVFHLFVEVIPTRITATGPRTPTRSSTTTIGTCVTPVDSMYQIGTQVQRAITPTREQAMMRNALVKIAKRILQEGTQSVKWRSIRISCPPIRVQIKLDG